jgi:hypothetical protein
MDMVEQTYLGMDAQVLAYRDVLSGLWSHIRSDQRLFPLGIIGLILARIRRNKKRLRGFSFWHDDCFLFQ